jgi:hypothetical protein
MPGKGGQIAAELTLDTKAFARGLDEANKKANEWTGSLKSALSSVTGSGAGQAFDLFSSLGGVKGIVTGTGLVGGLTAAFTGIADVIKDTYEHMRAMGRAGIDLVGQQNRMAARFQTSTEEMGALQLAAERYNVSLESVTRGQAFFNRLLADARRGSREAVNAFSSLGIGVDELGGNAMALQRRILDGLASLDAANRERLAMQFFGRGGGEAMETIAMRAGGGVGLERIQREGLQSGAIASNAQAQEVAALNRQLQAVRQGITSSVRGEFISSTPSELRRQLRQAQAELILLGANHNEVFAMGAAAPAPTRPSAEATRRAELRQEAEGIRDHVQQVSANWNQVNDRLTEQHATLGMNNFEVQRYRLGQERTRIEQQLQSEAMEQLTRQERERLQAQVQGLNALQQNLTNLQQVHEIEQERLATLTLTERMEEGARHHVTEQGAARSRLVELERTEGRLGLNQPARMARAVSLGSAEAINQINASALEGEAGNRSIADRIEAVMAAERPMREQQARDLAEIADAVRAGAFGRPASVN